MKRLSFVLALLLAAAGGRMSGQALSVAPAHLVCSYKLPDKVDLQVKAKLQRALTTYGISAEPDMSRFALVPEVAINDEQTSASVPAYCNVDFDFVVSLKDAFTGTVFASTAINVKGRGTNKENAISRGIAQLQLGGGRLAAFCDEARDKIVSYYSANVEAIVARAKACASGQNYEEALYTLSVIPEGIPGYATKVAPVVEKIYAAEINNQGEAVLTRAKAEWATSPNADGAARVAETLKDMPPGCSSVKEARQLTEQIANRLKLVDDRAMALVQKQLDNEHQERSQYISAARSVGVAWARNQPKQQTKVYLW